MNPRLELYVAGAALAVREVRTKKGGRVIVLDEWRRAKPIILRLLLSGMTPREVARHLDLPLATVCKLGLRALSEKNWISSNLSVAGVGKISYSS